MLLYAAAKMEGLSTSITATFVQRRTIRGEFLSLISTAFQRFIPLRFELAIRKSSINI
jgi:hypothetical protein